MSKRRNQHYETSSENEQIFRYWVELRDLRDGSVRTLPLRAIARVHIPTKRNPVQQPSERFLQLDDGATKLEANDLDGLATQLRQKYPDEAYVRTLHRERDYEAERAMDELVKLVAKLAVEEVARTGDTPMAPPDEIA